MPSEKRARQRAAREIKRQELARRARRRTRLRNAAIMVVLAVVVVGSVLLITHHSSPAKKSTTTTSTTKASSNSSSTTSSTATTSPSNSTSTTGVTATNQTTVNKAAVAAGCPATPKTRVNTLTWKTPPAMTIDTTKTYKATLKTTAGTIVITLLAKTAPKTVNNFVYLADQNYYKCNIFHRVVTGFVDQTGDPTGTGTGGPGYKFANENVPTAYATGDVAMANSGGTDTNGSQFFIVTPGGATTLNSDLKQGDGYSLFGKVSAGLTVAEAINAEGSSAGTPKVTERILSVTVTTS